MMLLLNILSLILALPFQMVNVQKTLLHLNEHRTVSAEHRDSHEHGEAGDHDHHQDNQSAADHSHGKDEPTHSHAKDLWGAFVTTEVAKSPLTIQIIRVYTRTLANFEYQNFQGRIAELIMLRPPISA